ncbi:hypothetical protein GA0070624_1720 [Micromonospora rhizosphaerae]|uniref:Uncharacterized protein n=1 Tax=Micromonospora rhizosphaerae TaxID=568872 RepID=A0A1C6RPY9_9ACTN|nr:hypothetical protein [Micromonospora rhizosphaerae]SCL19273.1 hypothetical protein GA0070624_1720 [Micromonospora rhizosphaerae]
MIDVELLMDELGRAGVSVLLKVDHERTADFIGKPWTMLPSGPGLGERGLIRTDAKTLEDALDYCLGELVTCAGD